MCANPAKLGRMGFSTPSYDLIDIFNRIDRGDLQLPDFQRDYRWDVDRIRSLLVTVLRGYPIGTLMALDTRNAPLRFRPRALQGAPDTGVAPGLLLLDGQQRITSLYQCLRGDGLVHSVDLRNKKAKRRFYVDIHRAVEEEVMPDEAVISVDENGRVRSHFAQGFPEVITPENAIDAGLIPVHALLTDEGSDMLFDLAGRSDEAQRERTKRFHNAVLRPLVRYAVPMTRLDRETAQEGIGSIFAQANAHGLQMDVFELLTAVFAAEDPQFKLQEDWAKTESVLRRYPALDGISKTEFLTAVALYITARKGHSSGQREAILSLTLSEYKDAAEKMRAAFHEAANYMRQRCILTTSQVPYTQQLIPLAAIIAVLAEDVHTMAAQESWDRLNRWFWCGVFGELYGSPAVTIRMGQDVDELAAWIRHEREELPASIRGARFVESRLLSAGPDSGLYKGIYALLEGRGARDWRTGTKIDQHTAPQLGVHFRPIFPLTWCEENGISPVLAHSVLNRTPMGRRTYVMVEESSPARYLYRVQSKSLMDDAEFDEVLASHYLDPHLLFSANAEAFFNDRRRKLLCMIEEAMGTEALHDVNESDLHGGEEGPGAFDA
ncbi:hypothetical protein CGERO_04865 [Corynebacterium gerontici]|uniref:GmrSD restriction endonucleases N-terminal domain-containing protein n=2 Tax=Corynebacterium gerontici TaxID=2079234 RepID=A0A3G6IZT3_9CORY|nr:hypothetical protein CGERO_04865 [Corynebacterium gerontici]